MQAQQIKMGKTSRKKRRKDAPLVPPPIASRRVARRVTSEFHRLAQDAARAPTAAARAAAERVLEARRGRYQEASALSTALHSTSRWVLRVLRCVEIKILRHVRAASSRGPPRHRRDACSMAWRCRFLAARPSQDGRVIAEK